MRPHPSLIVAIISFMLRRNIKKGLIMSRLIAGLLIGFVAFGGFASQGEAKSVVGWASFYKSGKRTANGERFNPHGLTAAHRSLPFGTKVLVTNLKNGKSVIVRINDRGPFVHGRVLDLSFGAAKVVGLNLSGVAKIKFEVVG
jgi:rare lipoprotein A